jgi:hypothetical protein
MMGLEIIIKCLACFIDMFALGMINAISTVLFLSTRQINRGRTVIFCIASTAPGLPTSVIWAAANICDTTTYGYAPG